jgi:hypothetical protein
MVAGALAQLALAGAATAAPERRTVTGRVASLEGDVLQVSIRPAKTVDVKLVGTTRYLKWVTQKPLQRDIGAGRSLLRVGQVVAVETRAGEAALEARLVRISSTELTPGGQHQSGRHRTTPQPSQVPRPERRGVARGESTAHHGGGAAARRPSVVFCSR